MLRSLAHWAGGVSRTERSIHEAYLYAVDKAEHFIYIEVGDAIKYLADSCTISMLYSRHVLNTQQWLDT